MCLYLYNTTNCCKTVWNQQENNNNNNKVASNNLYLLLNLFWEAQRLLDALDGSFRISDAIFQRPDCSVGSDFIPADF